MQLYLFLISPSFGASGGLCFVIVTFLGYLYLHFCIDFQKRVKGTEFDAEPYLDKDFIKKCKPKSDEGFTLFVTHRTVSRHQNR